MIKKLVVSLLACAGCVMGPAALAYEADQVRIVRIESFNSVGHLYVQLSGNANCPTTQTPYFIIQRWDDQAEPTKTQRLIMYQMALTAFMSGKTIRVVGATCYLNNYLFADQVMIYE